MRWQDPDRGLVPPGEFIAVAEETGLIDQLGAVGRSMRSARQRLAWRADGLDPVAALQRLAARAAPRRLRRRPARLPATATGSTPAGLVDRDHRERPRWPAAADRRAAARAGRGRPAHRRSTTSAPAPRRWRGCATLPVQMLKLDRSFLAGVPERPAGGGARHARSSTWRGAGRERSSSRASRPRRSATSSAAPAARWPRASCSAARCRAQPTLDGPAPRCAGRPR